MNMQKSKNTLLFTLVVQTILLSIYEGVLFYNGLDASEPILKLNGYIYLILLTMWVDIDSKYRSNILRCFEYKFLVAIFWIPYLPYYFVKTRGFLIGASVLMGFIFLFEFSTMVKMIILFTN